MDKNKRAIALFDKHAKTYQDKYMNVDLYGDSLDRFCEATAIENANILELACGPGNVTRYLLDKRPDFKILGTDLAPNMLELARQNNPEAEFLLMDCRDIGRITEKYDGIMCGFCLPYLSKKEAIALIADASNLLKNKGLFYISTMEDDYEKSAWKGPSSGGPDQLFLYYHQADYLSDALLENGFSILDLQRKTYPGADGSITTDLILLAQKL